MAYDRTNTGTLGKNRNPKSDRSPTFTGSLNIKGVEHWMSGWLQEDFLEDTKYISLSLNEKNDQNAKGSGRLDPNKDKMGRQPDYKGTVIVQGAKMDVAAWAKSGTNADGPYKFLSISVDTSKPAVAGGDQNFGQAYGDVPTRSFDTMTEAEKEQAIRDGILDLKDFDDDVPF